MNCTNRVRDLKSCDARRRAQHLGRPKAKLCNAVSAAFQAEPQGGRAFLARSRRHSSFMWQHHTSLLIFLRANQKGHRRGRAIHAEITVGMGQ